MAVGKQLLCTLPPISELECLWERFLLQCQPIIFCQIQSFSKYLNILRNPSSYMPLMQMQRLRDILVCQIRTSQFCEIASQQFYSLVSFSYVSVPPTRFRPRRGQRKQKIDVLSFRNVVSCHSCWINCQSVLTAETSDETGL